jgi:hypothetical protein
MLKIGLSLNENEGLPWSRDLMKQRGNYRAVKMNNDLGAVYMISLCHDW